MFHRNGTKSRILCVFLEKPGCSSLQNTEKNTKFNNCHHGVWSTDSVQWHVPCSAPKTVFYRHFWHFHETHHASLKKKKPHWSSCWIQIASTFICYMIFAQKCLKLAFFSCKMLFSAPKQPSFVDDTVCLTCWQAGKKGCNPWAFTPAAENLKFFFPPVGPFFNHTPPDPRNLASPGMSNVANFFARKGAEGRLLELAVNHPQTCS